MFTMEKRVRRRRAVRWFLFWFAIGLLVAAIRHALAEAEIIKALLFS